MNTNRLFTLDEYKQLTRQQMYEALNYASPTLARGKTRARKEDLIDAYTDASNTDSIPVVMVNEGGTEVVRPVMPVSVVPDEVPTYAAGHLALTAAAEVAPGLLPLNAALIPASAEDEVVEAADPVPWHTEDNVTIEHLPGPPKKLRGERVNPKLGEAEDTRLYGFADNTPRELDAKELALVDRLETNLKQYKESPADSRARREAASAVYELKRRGIIVNPAVTAFLQDVRQRVRDARRTHSVESR